MAMAYWRTPRGKRAALAVVVTVVAAFFTLLSDADARPRKRVKPHGWHPGFASIVIDAKTGKVLDEEYADSLRHPASLTKIMTLYLLFEQLEAGKLKLNSRLEVSDEAADQPPSKLGLGEGTTIAVEDAIKALITRSANDVAVVVAEAIAGDQAAFAGMMTRKARALGMSRTVFMNASGLPHRNQVTTARDMATLGRAIQDRFPNYYRYFSTTQFHWRGRMIGNHNRLLGRVTGVDGIKTGYTNASGFNLVTSVRHKNRHLVAVVLGGRTGASRDAQMRELISDYLDDANPGPRTAPLVAEAPERVPVRTAEVPSPRPRPEAPKQQQAKQPVKQAQPVRTAVVSSPRPRPEVVTGSTDPIRPIPVRTLLFGPNGETKTQTANANAAAALPPSNFSAANAVPMPLSPNAEGDANGTTNPAIAQANAFLAQPQTQVAAAAVTPPLAPNTESDTEALVAEAAELERRPAPTVKRPQVASANAAAFVPAPETHAVPAAARHGWSIQIGAYPDAQQAKERLDEARSKAAGVLARASPYTEKVSRGSSELFRARFAGFANEAVARRACQSLQRNSFDCMAVRN